MPELNTRFRTSTFILLVMTLCLTGCRFFSSQAEAPTPASKSNSLSLYEQRLLDIIEREENLDAFAQKENADYQEVQRRFQNISREYRALLADNPDQLEAHLLYGKFLSRYGDSDGARVQFLLAAKIDPNLAIIHQELGNYYAEEGDETRALAHFLKAAHLGPEEAVYHFGLGQLLAAYRDDFLMEDVYPAQVLDAQMMEAFREAARLEPDNLTFQFRLGEAFYDVDTTPWEEALNHWNTLQENPGLSDLQANAVTLHRARCLIQLNRFDQAKQLLHQINAAGLQMTKQSLLDQIP